MSTVGVLGAGISGLSAAYTLAQRDISVQVLEASSRPGGVIRSERRNGYLVEHGPNSIRAGSSELEVLIDEVGLTSQRVWANDVASTRYVVRDGRPTALPRSVSSFLTTDLFSTRAKLRLLAEPFVGRPSEHTSDESIASFTQRRMGPEILDYVVAPFVGGVFAASPEQLSVQHAFPRLAALERNHGSLFVGALKRALGASSSTSDGSPSGLFSFRDGLDGLPTALADALGSRLHLQHEVTSIQPSNSGWTVTVSTADESTKTYSFDALVSTIPLHQLPEMKLDTTVDPSPISDVSYPPLSVLALGYPESAVRHPLDGFGMLVPPVEDLNILGTIFSSTLFPNRAPDDHVLLTTFVGGARDPDLVPLDTSDLRILVERDLDALLGLTASPTFVRHVHWPRSIPQFTLGYGRVRESLDELEGQYPTLAFGGNYRSGVSVGDALTSGVEAAQRLLDRLSI